MMRASTGKAVMAMAAPRKRIASNVRVFSEKSPGTLTSHSASAVPMMKGTSIPARDTETALRMRLRKSSVLNSTPTRNM